MTVITVFVTHGLLNAALLAFSPVRCAYWNRTRCSPDEDWILNWLALGQFHLHLLLGCLAKTAQGKTLLEQRLAVICAAIIISYLSAGVFMLDFLNKSMAAVQLVVYVGLLAALVHSASTASPVTQRPGEYCSSYYDPHKRLPSITTVAVAAEFVLSTILPWNMTFGCGLSAYLGDAGSPIFQNISHSVVTLLVLISLLLAASVLWATVDQQRELLLGHSLALFVGLILLAGQQGIRIDSLQVRASAMTTFASIVLALYGGLTGSQ